MGEAEDSGVSCCKGLGTAGFRKAGGNMKFLKGVADAAREEVGTAMHAIENTEDAGSVVNAGEDAPHILFGDFEIQFKVEVMEQPRRLAIFHEFNFRIVRGVGQAVAEGETRVEKAVPGKKKPAGRDEDVELPMVLQIKMFDHLAFPFQRYVLLVAVEFLASGQSKDVGIRQVHFSFKNLADVAVGSHASEDAQEPCCLGSKPSGSGHPEDDECGQGYDISLQRPGQDVTFHKRSAFQPLS